MNVYKKNNSPYWHFAPTLTIGTGRRQHVINSNLTDKRAATDVMRKTVLLAESVEAQVPLTPELRRWLDNMNPKLRKRLTSLGLIGEADAAAANGVGQHVEEYLADCLGRGDGNDFVKIKRSQLNAMLNHTGAKRFADLSVDAVAKYLSSLKTTGKSNRTRNQHRATTIAWLNWCVARGRLDHHRLDTIPRLNEDLDRKRNRRAATEAEIERLLEVMPPHRQLVFLAAVFTGLRRGELNQIERRDIDLTRRTLTVRAEVGKTKKPAMIPLHAILVESLHERIVRMRATDLVFKPVPMMKTFRRDLERAGIEYKDENGRQLDFHALRSTFATRLLRSGIHPAVARRYTRHASVKTLEKHYDMLGLDDAMRDIDKLPGIGEGC